MEGLSFVNKPDTEVFGGKESQSNNSTQKGPHVRSGNWTQDLLAVRHRRTNPLSTMPTLNLLTSLSVPGLGQLA